MGKNGQSSEFRANSFVATSLSWGASRQDEILYEYTYYAYDDTVAGQAKGQSTYFISVCTAAQRALVVETEPRAESLDAESTTLPAARRLALAGAREWVVKVKSSPGNVGATFLASASVEVALLLAVAGIVLLSCAAMAAVLGK
jgi:hypothetical protein